MPRAIRRFPRPGDGSFAPRIRGSSSSTGANPKHSFRLFFRDEYGAESLDFPLFGAEGADSFAKVDLRTAQNQSWS